MDKERATSTSPTNKICRILVIEDHDDTRTVLEMMMRAEGFETACAATAQEALALAETFIPDIILSDISLPQIDGYQLLKALRRLPGLESVPAIALTGLSDKTGEFLRLQEVFEAYMLKPLDYDLLFEKISTLTNGACSRNR